MPLDPAIFDRNRASANRIRQLAARLSDDELSRRVGEHWTVAVVLAHLAWWDRRILLVLERAEREGKLVIPEPDVIANDISLPLLAAIPPREAARIAVETAETLDRRLESSSPALLEGLYAHNPRWVERARHRTEHLDEAEAALRG